MNRGFLFIFDFIIICLIIINFNLYNINYENNLKLYVKNQKINDIYYAISYNNLDTEEIIEMLEEYNQNIMLSINNEEIYNKINVNTNCIAKNLKIINLKEENNIYIKICG